MKALVAIAVLCLLVVNSFKRRFKISTDTLLYLLVMISGIAVIIFNIYKKRYYVELAAVIFILLIYLFYVKYVFLFPNSISLLQAIIGLIVLGLAFVATSVRLVMKIKKGNKLTESRLWKTPKSP